MKLIKSIFNTIKTCEFNKDLIKININKQHIVDYLEYEGAEDYKGVERLISLLAKFEILEMKKDVFNVDFEIVMYSYILRHKLEGVVAYYDIVGGGDE